MDLFRGGKNRGNEIHLIPLANRPMDMANLQKVIEAAPDYSLRCVGRPPKEGDAQAVFASLPPGKGNEDKFVWGIFCGDRMIGFMDVARGYPNPATAYIGLLLLSESEQRGGLGFRAYQLAEQQIRAWPGIQRIRLSVLRTNDRVLPFWRKCGFRETGEIIPYTDESLTTEAILLEKTLD